MRCYKNPSEFLLDLKPVRLHSGRFFHFFVVAEAAAEPDGNTPVIHRSTILRSIRPRNRLRAGNCRF
jgi:hypothetical protein